MKIILVKNESKIDKLEAEINALKNIKSVVC